MQAGEICGVGGQYCCLYHLKNKIKIKKGSAFPQCNFAGLNCKGEWYILKEIKEKTREEINAERNRRRQLQDRRKWIDVEHQRKLKEPKINKWDFEKW
jgi:hypothetical protein